MMGRKKNHGLALNNAKLWGSSQHVLYFELFPRCCVIYKKQ